MTREQVHGLFTLAGVPVLRMWELPNGYWPRVPEYQEYRDKQPWWLVKTPAGLVEIGWRKRVIMIDWSDTGVVVSDVTSDDVTKTGAMVHAWSIEDALKYLRALWPRLQDAVQQAAP